MEQRLKEVIYTPTGTLYVSVDSTGNLLIESESDRRQRLIAICSAGMPVCDEYLAVC